MRAGGKHEGDQEHLRDHLEDDTEAGPLRQELAPAEGRDRGTL